MSVESPRVAEFRREVKDKLSVAVHRGPLDAINRIYEKQCEDFLVEQYADLDSECRNMEGALRGEQGIEFADGYCVNVAALRHEIDECWTMLGHTYADRFNHLPTALKDIMKRLHGTDKVTWKLIAFVKELADEPCSYGDNCPVNAGTRHYTCLHCKAREALGLRK